MPDLLDDLRRYGDAVESAALDRSRPSYVTDDHHLTGHRRLPSRRFMLIGAAAAVMLVAALVAVAVLASDDDHDSVRIDTPPTIATTPIMVDVTELGPSAAEWTAIPAGPLDPRDGQSAVWTGSEMILWGGAVPPFRGGPSNLVADGAAYDLTNRSWRMLPRAPISARARHVGAWTGTEMIVFGGGGGTTDDPPLVDGAAFDPLSDQWRLLTRSPLPAGPGYGGAWTGDEFVVVGTSGEQVHAAAYDPRTDTWRLIDTGTIRLPSEDATLAVHWTGDRVVAVSPLGAGNVVVVYDPATGRWSSSTPSGFGARALGSAVLDGQLHLISYSAGTDGSIAFDAVSERWSDPARLPGLGCEDVPLVTSTSSQLLVQDGCRRAGLYDPNGRTLAMVPGAPMGSDVPVDQFTSTVWTGDQLITWGYVLDTQVGLRRQQAWALTPG